MAWPIILANAATPLLGLVDTAVIGHTRPAAALGAIAIRPVRCMANEPNATPSSPSLSIKSTNTHAHNNATKRLNHAKRTNDNHTESNSSNSIKGINDKHIISNSAQNNVPLVTSNNNNEEKNKNGLSSTSIKQQEHDRSLSWVTNYFGTNTYPSLSNELSVEELSEQSERDIEYKRLRTHATDDTARMKWVKSSNHTIDKSTKSGKSTSTATGKSRKAKRFSPPKDKEVRGTKNRLLSWVSIFFDAYFSQSTPEVRNAQSFILLNILCESL